jgi:6-phosphofructokinase 1
VLLLNEKESRLITTKCEQLKQIAAEGHIEHPLVGKLPPDAFVPLNASIPVLADDDVLSVFRKCHACSHLPQFSLAGARETYKLDPSRLSVGVLTAGGNAPGLDAIVDSLVKRQFSLGTEQCKKTDIALTAEKYPPELKFYGIVGGYRGLLELEDATNRRWVRQLHPRETDAWATRGCSTLHALRTNSYALESDDEKERESAQKEFEGFVNTLAEKVRKLRLDILYTIGGNGTLMVADALGKKLLDGSGAPCLIVAGPKTMDNDINFTDVTFGFRTTVDNAIQFLRDFHREAETLERVGIVELFGADSGFVALHAAYASGEADYVLIPEMMGGTIKSASDELQKAIAHIRDRLEKKRHAMLVVAEGATTRAYEAMMSDAEERKRRICAGLEEMENLAGPLMTEQTAAAREKVRASFVASAESIKELTPGQVSDTSALKGFQHGRKKEQEKAFAELVEYIKRIIGHDVFFSQPRHLIRATPPNGFDMDLCKYTGKLMVDTALSGFTRCAVHLWQGNYVLVPLETAVAKLKRVDTSGYYFMSMWEKYLLD